MRANEHALVELGRSPQWVAHTAPKVPISPSGSAASTTDPSTWGTVEEAMQIRAAMGLAGVGFVFTNDDPYVGIDLDDAVDPETGDVRRWAQEIVDRLDSYTEVSPSGTGLHILVRGETLRPGAKCGGIEVYSSKRYFTVTGRHIPGTPTTIEDRTDVLKEWYREVFGRSEPPRQDYESPPVDEWLDAALSVIPSDDYEVWTRVGMAMKNELGEAGFDRWHQWSRGSPKYPGERRCHRKWTTFAYGGELTLATVVYLARQQGFTPRTPTTRRIDDAEWDAWLAAQTARNTKAAAPTTAQCTGAKQMSCSDDTKSVPNENDEGYDWTKLRPLSSAPPPDWPEGMLPQPFERFVAAVAEETQTPRCLAAMLVLAMLGTILQLRYVVRLRGSYVEPLPIWMCCAMKSGNRKSAVFAAVLGVLYRAIKEENIRRRAAREQIEAETERTEAELKRVAKELEKEPERAAEIREQMTRLEAGIQNAPKGVRMIAEDATPESLAILMKQNGERIGTFSDEGGVFDILDGHYSRGKANLDVYLKAHSVSPVRVDRVGRPPVEMDTPAMSIGVTPQPSVVASVLSNPRFETRGLLARFSFAEPASLLGSRDVDPAELPKWIVNEYESRVLGLIDFDVPAQPEELRLSPEARLLWLQFAKDNERMLRGGGVLEQLEAWAGKRAGLLARVAGLLHIAAGKGEDVISVETMRRAISIVEWLTVSTLGAHGLTASGVPLARARAVLHVALAHGGETITRREIHQKMRAQYPRVAQLVPVLDVLVEHGYLRELPPTAGPGRPSIVYEINPQLAGFEGFEN